MILWRQGRLWPQDASGLVAAWLTSNIQEPWSCRKEAQHDAILCLFIHALNKCEMCWPCDWNRGVSWTPYFHSSIPCHLGLWSIIESATKSKRERNSGQCRNESSNPIPLPNQRGETELCNSARDWYSSHFWGSVCFQTIYTWSETKRVYVI